MLGGSLSDEALEAAGADEDVQDLVKSLIEVDPEKCDTTHLAEAVAADHDTLLKLRESLSSLKAIQPENDPKIAALRRVLESLPAADSHGVPTKVVIFTNYRDTAFHLFQAFGGAKGGLPAGQLRARSN